jgi:SAM-dependent methyltransferase
MSSRRPVLSPWRTAGAHAAEGSVADTARDVGWVFNNETDQPLTEFVQSGWVEAVTYGQAFGLFTDHDSERAMVEIGSGIGRMTAPFSQRFGTVIACDVDEAFLERCRETVAGFGGPGRLDTAHVADGAHLPLPDDSADAAFSYITFQHCSREGALSLATEAARVVRPGGRIALNFRSWVLKDLALVPAGVAVRFVWRVFPRARWLRGRTLTRLGWQANRLGPRTVLAHLAAAAPSVHNVELVEHAHRPWWRRWLPSWQGCRTGARLDWIDRSHWWLVADVT